MKATTLLGLGLALTLCACGPESQVSDEMSACAGTCEGEIPAGPEILSLQVPLVECLALPTKEQCSDPAFCHDLLQCTVKHAPAGMRWDMLAIRARPLPLEEGATGLTALLNNQEILFKQGEDMVVELGTFARRQSYRVELEAYLSDMGSSSKVDFDIVAAAVEGELTSGGEPLVLEAPCGSWAVTFILPEEFDQKSARVRVKYPLSVTTVEPQLVDTAPLSEVTVSASSRLTQSEGQATLLLPVRVSQAPIQALVTYYPAGNTEPITILPGELVLPW